MITLIFFFLLYELKHNRHFPHVTIVWDNHLSKSMNALRHYMSSPDKQKNPLKLKSTKYYFFQYYPRYVAQSFVYIWITSTNQ